MNFTYLGSCIQQANKTEGIGKNCNRIKISCKSLIRFSRSTELMYANRMQRYR